METSIHLISKTNYTRSLLAGGQVGAVPQPSIGANIELFLRQMGAISKTKFSLMTQPHHTAAPTTAKAHADSNIRRSQNAEKNQESKGVSAEVFGQNNSTISTVQEAEDL